VEKSKYYSVSEIKHQGTPPSLSRRIRATLGVNAKWYNTLSLHRKIAALPALPHLLLPAGHIAITSNTLAGPRRSKKVATRVARVRERLCYKTLTRTCWKISLEHPGVVMYCSQQSLSEAAVMTLMPPFRFLSPSSYSASLLPTYILSGPQAAYTFAMYVVGMCRRR